MKSKALCIIEHFLNQAMDDRLLKSMVNRKGILDEIVELFGEDSRYVFNIYLTQIVTSLIARL